MHRLRLIAFDLDGTLCQHRSPLPYESLALLGELAEDFGLLIVGAGSCERIHHQMDRYPIDIIGNYGMQTAEFIKAEDRLALAESHCVPVQKQQAILSASELRRCYGWEDFIGETVEFHPSGMMTLPLLGTKASIEDKLAADPSRIRRKTAYEGVCKRFSEYTVFIGGSSSFDIVPKPYCKRFALEKYAKQKNLKTDEILYVGDDYGPGGNDEDLYTSGIRFVCVDDYRHVTQVVKQALRHLRSDHDRTFQRSEMQ
ncbi:MAG: HAD family hydrolase [Eubacteriales bacterium]|nr:HAD family hydrolase [Eubacteriales bacterium]MDD4105484.1 HAD family hydrolase [Eubacteriales bacterium]MDD4710479.1 HAD family hydrolase [Eubacteriales bacterium]